MSKVEITPGGSDFRLMDKVAVEAFRRYRERARFIRGLVNTLGFKVATFEFTAPPRFAGHSKYNLRKMLHFALESAAALGILYRHCVRFNEFSGNFTRSLCKICCR